MWIISLLLVLGSVFFVAAEYSIVSARRSRVDALAKRGNKRAKDLAKELDNVSSYVAGSQIGITMISIGVGSITEPFVTDLLTETFGKLTFLRDAIGPQATKTLGYAISFFLVSFVLVVVGELCPKYYALRRAEEVALITFRPLRFLSILLRPIIWLAQSTAGLILRLAKIDIHAHEDESIPKEELLMLVQTGGNAGVLDKTHADMVTRALRLDVLDARDIMIHRLDIKWLDVDLNKQELFARLRQIPFTRLPVCRGDIDDMVGLAYLHDIVKYMDDRDFSLAKVVRPMVAIPENLSMEKIVETMRTEKTQMLIVMDEYGGTSGLVTLEDVVEEVFGELEDRLESERPPIEQLPGNRVSARADIRFDELVSRLSLPIDPGENTDTLATIMIDALERVPRPGDSVKTNLGLMRVENMARRRITRVSIQLAPELIQPAEEE
ncbi:hemolysin family protein [Fimbriimonas ginsengisoli]|uniref:hemolysin family protein n=1 Tax=Fimbriimonas ginsengisoli TaxID=1005039 RepID=UPI0003E95163|nr:hemolysin family protein [Fimbriimonas ginsengisoli]